MTSLLGLSATHPRPTAPGQILAARFGHELVEYSIITNSTYTLNGNMLNFQELIELSYPGINAPRRV